MKWKKESRGNYMIESASDMEGNRYEIRAKERTRSWATYRNGILVDDVTRTRHNAKALVDSTLEARQDLRLLPRKMPPRDPSNPKVRRTNREIEINKQAFCGRCGRRDKEGAVVLCQPTTWEPKEFHICSLCLTDLAGFFQPVTRPLDQLNSEG